MQARRGSLIGLLNQLSEKLQGALAVENEIRFCDLCSAWNPLPPNAERARRQWLGCCFDCQMQLRIAIGLFLETVVTIPLFLRKGLELNRFGKTLGNSFAI
jgi:hypothetical protein